MLSERTASRAEATPSSAALRAGRAANSWGTIWWPAAASWVVYDGQHGRYSRVSARGSGDGGEVLKGSRFPGYCPRQLGLPPHGKLRDKPNYRAANGRAHRLRRRRVATRRQPRAKQLNAQSNKQRPEQKSAVFVLRLLD